jgi:hypothetical protein
MGRNSPHISQPFICNLRRIVVNGDGRAVIAVPQQHVVSSSLSRVHGSRLIPME